MIFHSKSFFGEKALTQAEKDAILSRFKANIFIKDKNGKPAVSAWIQSGDYSVPLFVTDKNTPLVKVWHKWKTGQKQYSSILHSILQKGIPIPADFHPAKGDDGHAFIWDKYRDIGYGFYQIRKEADGLWYCSTGEILYGLSKHDGRLDPFHNSPENVGSRACGLALIGGVILYDELKSGVIPHALCCSVPRSDKSWRYPATKTDGSAKTQTGIPYGLKFRFPEDIKIASSWLPMTKMIVEAIRDYGLVAVDQTHVSTGLFLEDRTRFRDTGGNKIYKDEFIGGNDWSFVAWRIPWDKLILA